MAHPIQLSTEAPGLAGGEGFDGTASRPDSAAGPAYEDAILGIWRDVLGRDDIAVTDDFLTLGDHSLAPAVVSRIRATLGVDIPVMDFFESRTVTALARAVARRSDAARAANERKGVVPRPPDADPVLSFDQQRLWMESQLLPGVIYNVHARRRLVGPIDIPAFEASIRAILARHEALRSRFPTVAGQPVQVVDDPDDGWTIRFDDVSAVDGDREDAARHLMDAESTTPFDLATGPLFRCYLVRLSDTEHILGVTMHHIVSDTWSIGLFVRELAALYQAGGDPARADLPPLPVQYRDYAVWQRARLVGDALDRQVRYWRRHLAGAPPVLALPAAQRRTTSQRAEADRIEIALAREETTALHDLCRARGVTPFMAMLACLATVFGRWSGQDDVVIGVPLAGRTHSGTDNLIGFFVNVLPFRVDLSGDPTFAELFDRVRRSALEGYDHADAPLDVLVEDLQVRRDPRRTPLFEVVLNVVGSPEAEQVTGLAVEPLDSPSLFSRFDLSVTAQESEGSLRLQLDFACERCDATMVRVLVEHLRALLRGAMADPDQRILGYPLEPVAQEPEAPAEAPAPHLAVDRHAAATPGLTAVVDASGGWDYAWLSDAAGRVAGAVAGAEGQVAILRRPAAQFVAAILGCVKAGVPFTILDGIVPGDPLPGGVSTVLDPRPASRVAPGHVDVAALLRDAGGESPRRPAPSAGPAGDWAAGRFGFTSADRFAVLSTVPGQLISAVCSAVAAGAAVVVPDCSFAGGAGTVTNWLRANDVSVVYVSPSILRALCAQPGPDLPALRYAFVDNAGDLVSHDVGALRDFAPGCQFVGVYRVGPDGRPLAAYAVPDDWDLTAAPLRVPLGRALPGRPARVLKVSGKPAATGELGELWFGDLPTGDVGRRWPDGSVEYVGPAGCNPAFDPLETVATLRDVPDVRDALVVEQVGTDGATSLAGYVAGPDPALGTVPVHNYLRNRLPGYLIPEQLYVLEQLPRTPWGEYDLKQLPRSTPGTGLVDDYVAPRTSMERQLCELLEELLGVDRVGIYDSFFELGGFSLLATQLTTRLRSMFNVELALRDVFESPTVDELAQLIVRTQTELSGVDDLEALLNEIELGDAVDAALAGAATPAAPVDTYDGAVALLRESAFFAADKPDETPESTAQALWYAAAGTPRAVGSVTLPLPELTEAQRLRFGDLVARRVAGEPLAYLTGRATFLGLDVVAAPGALIPRRETEILGGAAVGMARELADALGEVRVLDLCTGAGNLAVSIAVLEPRARVWASDLEEDAVAVAERNVVFHGVTDRVTAMCGDLFGALEQESPRPGPFDLIVCNPPYMPSDKAKSLPVEVAGFEPMAAFDGGDVGLSVVYRLIAEAPQHLVPGGWLCFELGAGMGRVVEKRLAALGGFGEIRTVADADGITRVILARRLP